MKSITRFTKNLRGNTCLNCGTQISDDSNFCSKCGQVNDTNRLSLKQYFSEYLSGFFNFDNRFLKTVTPLLFKPGFVTKEYIKGKRIKYVNPFQLYLHITILFFLMIGIFSTIDRFKTIDEERSNLIPEINLEPNVANLDSIKSETINELKKNDVQIDSATLNLIDEGIGNLSTNKDSIKNEFNERSKHQTLLIKNYIDSLVANTNLIENFKQDQLSLTQKDTAMTKLLAQISERSSVVTDVDKNFQLNSAFSASMLWKEISVKGNVERQGIKYLDSIFNHNQITYEIPLRLIYHSDENQSGWAKIRTFIDYQKDYPEVKTSEALRKLGFELTYWNGFLFNKAEEWSTALGDEEYHREIGDRILSRISVALFFLLPIFTLVVSLLYIRRKYNYTENLVFVFHIQTVFFLLLLIFLIVDRLAQTNAGIIIFFIIFLIYLYKAMRSFYEQGWIKTTIKFLILNFSFMILALVGGLIISFLAFLI